MMPTDVLMIDEPLTIRVLTVNTHKGFNFFNRKLVLPELREAVRTVGADVVFLQEVLGAHEALSLRHSSRWPEGTHYEYLADQMRSEERRVGKEWRCGRAPEDAEAKTWREGSVN